VLGSVFLYRSVFQNKVPPRPRVPFRGNGTWLEGYVVIIYTYLLVNFQVRDSMVLPNSQK
jgi:hypothetical protein